MNDPPTPSGGGAWRRGRGGYPGWQVGGSFLLGWLFIIAGALGALYAPVSAWRTHEFLSRALRAKAPIVAFQTYPRGRHERHDTYRPVVAVIGATGRPVRHLVGAAAYPNPYRVGDSIQVLYRADDPAEVLQDTTEDVWGGTLLLVVLSPALLILGSGTVIWMRNFVRHDPEQLLWIDRWLVPLKLLTWR